RPRGKTVGTNVSSTPKGFHWTVMIGTPPVLLVCATGTGNSPPARKAAVSPESAIKSGSARRRRRPFVSSADRVTSRLPPLVARLAIATPKGTAAAPESVGSKVPRALNIGRPAGPLPPIVPPGNVDTGFPLASTQGGVPQPVVGGPTAGLPPAEGGPKPVAKPRFPALFAPFQFTPSSRLALRATSRNRTLSITCCDGATFIAFTMLPSGTMVLATSTARSAATALLATPLSTIRLLLLPTWMPP